MKGKECFFMEKHNFTPFYSPLPVLYQLAMDVRNIFLNAHIPRPLILGSIIEWPNSMPVIRDEILAWEGLNRK